MLPMGDVGYMHIDYDMFHTCLAMKPTGYKNTQHATRVWNINTHLAN